MNLRMNFPGLRAIYQFEMARTWRTLFQSVVSACRHHYALLHRVRRGDRIAYHGD